ncbi:methionine--tRNA ligase subunit beta [Lacticaseibacillus manihotivorans]|uniref:methionine--tRNA ligase subunit beta n=1 Tax=Lacticaseibacillus manihotivorans TaxID=88233 RepID=UPI001FB1DB79|nr:methionine--tRNA ligase subunit beta [Lacticaseibacillus manihotivorans]
MLIQPVMTHAPKQIFGQLGFDDQDEAQETLEWGHLPSGAQVVAKGTPIFPRLDAEAEVNWIKAQMTPPKTKATVKDEDRKDEIDFDTFDKSEIRVAEILDVEKVKGADKLLKFTLDAGDEGTRQIISGIAKYYPHFEELKGKKVMAVVNLKPRKLRGEMSEGMLLSSEDSKGKIALAILPDNTENGALIG